MCRRTYNGKNWPEVDTLLVKFPDFAFPDEDFIRTYKVLVPDISDLVQLGIGIWEVQETFRWLQTVQSYDVWLQIIKAKLGGCGHLPY